MRPTARTSPPPYRAPWWLPGGHAQTIYARLFARCPKPHFARETWVTPDDDVIAVDRIAGPASAPMVVMFHGLEGGSDSHYARALMAAVRELGWRGAVPHFRGCGGVPNRLPRAYHSGDSAEIDWVLRRFRGEAETAPLFVAGVSLGGNALTKWLAEQGDAARTVVHAAAAICAPLDLAAGGRALERGVSRIYSRYFLQSLKPKALELTQRFPGRFDAARIRASRTLRHFDDAVTAPMFGFEDADDYWRRSSAKPLLDRVRVPVLLINARNDPFQPADVLPGDQGLSPAIETEFTGQGGHVGYVTGPFPGQVGWLPARIIAFFSRYLDA